MNIVGNETGFPNKVVVSNSAHNYNPKAHLIWLLWRFSATLHIARYFGKLMRTHSDNLQLDGKTI